jgi:hypothetical protein
LWFSQLEEADETQTKSKITGVFTAGERLPSKQLLRKVLKAAGDDQRVAPHSKSFGH